MLGYTTFVNVLDYSAAVLPVTLVDKHIDVSDEGYEPMNEQDEKTYKSCELSSFISPFTCISLER